MEQKEGMGEEKKYRVKVLAELIFLDNDIEE